ncbi:MAG: DUF3800 domain-containing protein [Chloroflexota bacterium]
MAVVSCYLDDSGTHEGSGHVVSGGVLAPIEVWPDFIERWTDALSRIGVRRWHSTDAEGLRGEFVGWSIERRDAAREEMLGIVLGADGIITTGNVVPRRHWDNLMSTESQAVFGTPWGLATHMVVARIGDQIVKQGIDSDVSIQYIVDKPPRGYDRVARLFADVIATPAIRARYRMATIAPGSSSLHPQLQAADIVAYELYKEWDRWMRQLDRDYRDPMHRLMTALNCWGAADGAFIRAVDVDPVGTLYDV